MKPRSLRQFFTQAAYRAIFVSAVCLLLCSSVMMAFISRRNLHRRLGNLADQKAESVATVLNSATETVRNMAYNETLQWMLVDYRNQEFEDLTSAKIRINHEIENLSRFFAQAENVIVYAPDGRIIGNKYEVDPGLQEHFRELLDSVQEQGNFSWDLDIEPADDGLRTRHTLLVEIRASVSGGATKLNDVLGYLLVPYDISEAGRRLTTEQEDYGVYLVNEDGIFLTGNNPEIAPGSRMKGPHAEPGTVALMNIGGTQVYAVVEKVNVPAASLYCVCTVPTVQILEDVNIALLSILMLSVVIMLSTYFIIRRRTARICSTIDRLNDAFASIEQGRWDLDSFPDTDILEIDDLTRRCSHMADRLEELIHELYEAERYKQALMSDRVEAELLALRMQLNPHFLYNTLDTINWTALAHQDYEVSDMVLMLGKLFRSNLSISSTETTLKLELERLALFMKLEQCRFGEQLQCETDIADGLEDEPIPGLLLQLLTENAINHGLDLSAGRSLVRITVCASDSRLTVTVADNGHGMEPAVAENLRSTWTAMQKDTFLALQPSSHIGLRNIMKRLCLLYGAQASFSLETGPAGTAVRISYPRRPRDGKAETEKQ